MKKVTLPRPRGTVSFLLYSPAMVSDKKHHQFLENNYLNCVCVVNLPNHSFMIYCGTYSKAILLIFALARKYSLTFNVIMNNCLKHKRSPSTDQFQYFYTISQIFIGHFFKALKTMLLRLSNLNFGKINAHLVPFLGVLL